MIFSIVFSLLFGTVTLRHGKQEKSRRREAEAENDDLKRRLQASEAERKALESEFKSKSERKDDELQRLRAELDGLKKLMSDDLQVAVDSIATRGPYINIDSPLTDVESQILQAIKSNRDNELLYNYIPNRKYGLPKRSQADSEEKQWSAVDIFVNEDTPQESYSQGYLNDNPSEHYEDENFDEFDHEYVYFNKSNTPSGGDIYIRRQSRECETIMEEDEHEMVEFLSTRTSNVASSLGHNRSPEISPANTAARFFSRKQQHQNNQQNQSPFRVVEMHPAQKLPDDMSIVDSQTEKTLRDYPFYNQIKSQVMHLPIELTNSDWSDEAKFCDELRNHGAQAATNQSPPEQSRRNDFQKHKIQPADISYEPEPSEDDFAFPPPPEKDEPVYIRPSFPEKRNSRTRRARRDKYTPQIAKFKNESGKIQYENNQTPLATKRAYDQSAYGQFTRSSRYQSFPNYPRYRQPARRSAKSQPPLATYWLLAFLLFMLMFISLFPLMFM
ncbi:Oidioi.mRNA.OKI2018_I69.chr2.g6756.t3.cds [Oikopleura dioica]|uniref:Oidioi.mRNA.OKI2018_I69.chr2.g6756.t3.cds n=1 Tax=Oikopleura dioica TaxID=34765 RepID=A0ABN7T8U3_OIKDI|nr:Oidioi.mRNA.OKI2018_I69.chr2.g6756.t3.cds [Oikopleura dioica]